MAEVDTPPVPDSATEAHSASRLPAAEGAITGTLATAGDETALTITGAADGDDAQGQKKMKKMVRRKRRPARVQIDPSTIKSEPPPQTGTIFNIWYNKWSGGDREDKYLSQHAAPSRCNVARDSGYTRADRVPGSYFCLFFARGVCPKGHECEYLHRLPGVHDLFNPNVDCFGRDKFSDYRDDMGGVGTFMRQNRTLYIGRIHVTDDIEEVVARHFAEWGEVERIRVLNTRGVAFVTYTNEANSQFAKEAMAHQSLDHSEILNVRWATVDPNPMAQKRDARRLEEQAAEAVRRALPAEFVAEIEGKDPEARKRKKIEGSFGLQGYEAPDEVWYARQQAAAAVEPPALEGGEKKLMIENGPEASEQDGYKTAAGSESNEMGGGILSSSTLNALKNYSSQGQRSTFMSKPAAAPPGPLVAYGSDDDSD
ncbi:hypothetical protein L228DRAFT_246941 [Xylona heveae TC161]|uniref:Pre-mRNA-splicing factor CWC2 n=1 Tax=Xylona heveae (strain CBS 132557 / TC161) TaxID=1328760 RepID=A0A165GUB0_XYLHT|nr:hypothetical protein L228DRAFT_246941 [Xylona heveae TC161]KZF22606.1 hypothetical protein L228DRAFT_246941 [Xylona heveae TC161]